MILFFSILVIIAAILLLIVIIRDSTRFVTVNYRIPCRGLKREYRFVMLSDLHNKQFGRKNEKLLAEIHRLRPESILIAGDMLTSRSSQPDLPARELVGELASVYPVYYANGNHEYRLKTDDWKFGAKYEDYRRYLKSRGVVFLENENVLLPDPGIRIYGLEIEMDYYKKLGLEPMEVSYPEKLLGKPDADACNILIAHNPDYFPVYAKWGADLVLSGHVHGGIMRLPVLGGVLSPSLRLFPRYDGGLFEEGRSRMILGRGLGSHTIPIRIFNPGELIEVQLVPEECE